MTDVELAKLLGSQYNAIPRFMVYYKQSIKNRNLKLLDAYGMQWLEPSMFQGDIRYSLLADWFTLSQGGPFCLVSKNTGDCVMYGNCLDDTIAYLPESGDYKSAVRLLNCSTGKELSFYSKNYFVYPFASVYSAARVFMELVNDYSKNGVRILIDEKTILVKRVLLDFRDLKSCRVTIETASGSKKAIQLNRIESIVRLC